MGRAWMAAEDTKNIVLHNLHVLSQAARDVNEQGLANDIEAVYLTHTRQTQGASPGAADNLFTRLKLMDKHSSGH